MGFVQGGRQRSPHLTEGKQTPYLRVANVFDGYIDTSDVLEMPFTEAEFARYVLRPNDLLLNEGQSLELVGRCAKYEGDPKLCCFQNTLVRFQAGPECDTDYAYQLFRWCQQSGIFAQIATKTNSIAHLGSTRFAELELPFPPLPEQRQIAAILSQWDDSLSILSRLIDAKRQQKRGLAEALLMGKRRLPGFEGEWEQKKLGDIAAFNYGKSQNGVESGNGTYPIYGTAGVIGCTNTPLFDKPSIIVGRKGTIDRPILSLTPFWAIDTTFYVCVTDDVALTYLYYFLCSFDLKSLNEASGVPSLSRESLRSIVLHLPSLPEQRAIATVLSTLDEELSALERLRTSVQTQKRGLMDLLLTGKVRVKVEEAS